MSGPVPSWENKDWLPHPEGKVTIIRSILEMGKRRQGGLIPLARVPQPASGRGRATPGYPELAWGHRGACPKVTFSSVSSVGCKVSDHARVWLWKAPGTCCCGAGVTSALV